MSNEASKDGEAKPAPLDFKYLSEFELGRSPKASAKTPLEERKLPSADLDDATRKAIGEQIVRQENHHWQRSKEFHSRMIWLSGGAITTTVTIIVLAWSGGMRPPRSAFFWFTPAVTAWLSALLICLIAQLWAMAPLHGTPYDSFRTPGGRPKTRMRFRLAGYFAITLPIVLAISVSSFRPFAGPLIVIGLAFIGLSFVRPEKCNGNKPPTTQGGLLRQIRYLTHRYGVSSTVFFAIGCILFTITLGAIIGGHGREELEKPQMGLVLPLTHES